MFRFIPGLWVLPRGLSVVQDYPQRQVRGPNIPLVICCHHLLCSRALDLLATYLVYLVCRGVGLKLE